MVTLQSVQGHTGLTHPADHCGCWLRHLSSSSSSSDRDVRTTHAGSDTDKQRLTSSDRAELRSPTDSDQRNMQATAKTGYRSVGWQAAEVSDLFQQPVDERCLHHQSPMPRRRATSAGDDVDGQPSAARLPIFCLPEADTAETQLLELVHTT